MDTGSLGCVGSCFTCMYVCPEIEDSQTPLLQALGSIDITQPNTRPHILRTARIPQWTRANPHTCNPALPTNRCATSPSLKAQPPRDQRQRWLHILPHALQPASTSNATPPWQGDLKASLHGLRVLERGCAGFWSRMAAAVGYGRREGCELERCHPSSALLIS